VQVYASTVQQQVRAQVLTSISRMVYYNSPEMLRCARSYSNPAVLTCPLPACIKSRHHLHLDLPRHEAHSTTSFSLAFPVERVEKYVRKQTMIQYYYIYYL
jgi:hypothetical protein